MQETSNRSIYSCIKIKPVDYPIKMLSTNEDNLIKIKDLYNKTNIEEHVFQYDRVFSISNTNEDTYRYAAKTCISKIFDNINCCVIALGVSGSGKTYSLFGDYGRQLKTGNLALMNDIHGLATRTIQMVLLKADDLLGIREVVITCSFYDICHDKIRDLLKGITIADFDGKKVDDSIYEDMPLYENTGNDGIKTEHILRTGAVRYGTVVPIKDLKDLDKIFQHSYRMKEKLNLKNNDINAEGRSHYIFNLNIKITDNNDNSFPPINTLVQFVRFGGSQKMTKGMADKNKGEKFQENIVVNTDYSCFQKVIYGLYTGQKAVVYDSSKLMKMLRFTINHNSSIFILGCLNPNEANYEESLNTLSLMDRCKNYEEMNKEDVEDSGKEVDKKPKNKKSGKLTLVQQIQEKIQSMRNNIEHLENNHKKKFQQLANILDIFEGLNNLAYSSNEYQWNKLRRQKRANEKYEYMSAFKMSLDKRIDILKKEEHNLKYKRQDYEENHHKEVNRYKKEIEDLKIQLNDIKKSNQEFKADVTDEMSKMNKTRARVTKNILDNKISPLINLPNLIKKRTTAKQNIDTQVKLGVKDAFEIYEKEFEVIKQEHQMRVHKLDNKFSQMLDQKRDDYERMVIHFERFYSLKS